MKPMTRFRRGLLHINRRDLLLSAMYRPAISEIEPVWQACLKIGEEM